MFMSMPIGPFHNHLLGSSSAGFTELILKGEHVENGIKSGKIQVATSSNTTKKSYNGKKESMFCTTRRVVIRVSTTNLWGKF